jgi:hypothetical protein
MGLKYDLRESCQLETLTQQKHMIEGGTMK